jgi:hypothetical protein
MRTTTMSTIHKQESTPATVPNEQAADLDVVNSQPLIRCLYGDKPSDSRRNAYAAWILSSLLGDYAGAQPDATVAQRVDLAKSMVHIPNVEKAYCLGRAAVSFGAAKVAIVDLNNADDTPTALNEFMTEMSVLDAEVIIAAEPDKSPGRHQADLVIKRMLSSLNAPTLLTGADFVERVTPHQIADILPTAQWRDVAPLALSPSLD